MVACANPAYVKRLSDYYAEEERGAKPHLPQPWPAIRQDAASAVDAIIVSHRVRKKVSGPLHKETIYGDTRKDEKTKSGVYRVFVTRKKLDQLSNNEVKDIRDDAIRAIVSDWVEKHGGNPKKAFAEFPDLGGKGRKIRKARLTIKRQIELMAPVSTGYAAFGANHHIAIYKTAKGGADFEVVSLFQATRRLARREPLVRRNRDDGSTFVMSLCAGDTVKFAREGGEKASFWRVQKISGNGQISLLDVADASPEEPTLFEPTYGGLLSRNAEKLSVDPIGRIRAAND